MTTVAEEKRDEIKYKDFSLSQPRRPHIQPIGQTDVWFQPKCKGVWERLSSCVLRKRKLKGNWGPWSIVSATELINNEQPDFGKCTVRIVIALFEPQRLDFNL